MTQTVGMEFRLGLIWPQVRTQSPLYLPAVPSSESSQTGPQRPGPQALPNLGFAASVWGRASPDSLAATWCGERGGTAGLGDKKWRPSQGRWQT